MRLFRRVVQANAPAYLRPLKGRSHDVMSAHGTNRTWCDGRLESALGGEERKSDFGAVRSVGDPQQNSRSGCLFFRTAHECSITTQCLRSPAGRIESWRRGAGSRSPTIGRRALR